MAKREEVGISLTQFIKRPTIRGAFKKYAIKERTPRSMRGRPLLVPDSRGPRGLAGTAFDYLARFHLARELRESPVKVVDGPWIAERSIRWMCASPEEEQHWCEALGRARDEAAQYVGGGGNLRELAHQSQYLAHLDVLYRNSRGFDPAFRPLWTVTDDLLALLERFEPLPRLAPKRHCLLNPEFAASNKVGRADADLVVDDRLIEMKTTAKLSVTQEHLLQLAGYAALQRMGGISLGEVAHGEPFHAVEIYYARHGQLVRWSLDELFPRDGFDRFCQVFDAEIAADEQRRRESKRQYEMRRAERERNDQFDRDITKIRKLRPPRALLRLLVSYKGELGRDDEPYSLHAALFTALRRTIRAYARTAIRPRHKKLNTISSEIAAIGMATEPLQLARAFRRNEHRFVEASGQPDGVNSEDQLVCAALLGAARRIIRNRNADLTVPPTPPPRPGSRRRASRRSRRW